MRASCFAAIFFAGTGCTALVTDLPDGGHELTDSGSVSSSDGGVDASVELDAGHDGGSDAGLMNVDAGPRDAGLSPLIVGVGNWGLRGWSTDGVTWNFCGNMSTGNDHSPDLLRNIGFAGGVWLASGGDANSMIMRSLDGQHWQEDLHPTTACMGESYPASCTNWKDGIAFGNGVWLVGGGNGSLMRSSDGVTWAGLHPSPSIPAVRSIAFGNGRFVAGTDSAIATSADDGTSWTRFATSMSTTISFGNGRFFAQGQSWNGSGFDRICFTSGDLGMSWQPCAAEVASGETFAHDGARWVARVPTGFATSTDGLSWSVTASNGFPYSIRFDARGQRWLGINGSDFVTSTNLTSWAVLARNLPGFRSWAIGYVDGANLPITNAPACVDQR